MGMAIPNDVGLGSKALAINVISAPRKLQILPIKAPANASCKAARPRRVEAKRPWDKRLS